MTQTVFEKMKNAISVLKLDFTTEEFATFADDQELSEEAIEAVQTVFSYISEKKQQTTVQTLLKLSRLPKKAPKTFENFDFSLLKSRDLDRIRALPSLGAVYSHRNLAFIGPPGTGKTHLAQAFGYACCQHGMRAYFIKASELRDRFTAARRVGKTDSCLKYWRPAEIAPKGPARKANCGAKEKAITEFFQILYTELALNSACRAAYFCTYNLSPRKYLHPLADKGRQQ